MATLMTVENNMPADRRLVLKLGLACASVIVTLAALEAGSYLFGSFGGPEQPVQGGNIKIYGQHDQDLFWSLRPHAEARNGQRWINSDGLRGPEVGAKGDDEYRILNIGESTTFAAQVRYEECYSALLERMLNRDSSQRHVRSLNAGVPGYSTFQGVQFLLQRGLRFEPDMVTLYFGYNDFLSVAYLDQRAGDEHHSESGLTDRQLFELRSTPMMRLTWLLMRNSNFFRGIRQAFEPDPETRVVAKSTRARVPRKDRKSILKRARAFCQQHDIVLVVIVPIYRDFNAHQGFLRKFISNNDLISVDLPAVVPAGFTRPRATYFVDSVHPGADGHLLIAEAIYEVVSPLIR